MLSKFSFSFSCFVSFFNMFFRLCVFVIFVLLRQQTHQEQRMEVSECCTKQARGFHEGHSICKQICIQHKARHVCFVSSSMMLIRIRKKKTMWECPCWDGEINMMKDLVVPRNNEPKAISDLEVLVVFRSLTLRRRVRGEVLLVTDHSTVSLTDAAAANTASRSRGAHMHRASPQNLRALN